MENKLLWVPQLVHRDHDKQKCHNIAGLEAENGDSTEWKIQKGTSPTTYRVQFLGHSLHKEERGENCNHMRPHEHIEQKTGSRCASSSPVDLLQVRDAYKSQWTTPPFKLIPFQDMIQIRPQTYLLLGTCWKSNGYSHAVRTDSWRVPLHMPADFSVPQVWKLLETHPKSPLFHCSTTARLVINLECKWDEKQKQLKLHNAQTTALPSCTQVTWSTNAQKTQSEWLSHYNSSYIVSFAIAHISLHRSHQLFGLHLGSTVWFPFLAKLFKKEIE